MTMNVFRLLDHSPNVLKARKRSDQREVLETPSRCPGEWQEPKHLSHHSVPLGHLSRDVDAEMEPINAHIEFPYAMWTFLTVPQHLSFPFPLPLVLLTGTSSQHRLSTCKTCSQTVPSREYLG